MDFQLFHLLFSALITVVPWNIAVAIATCCQVCVYSTYKWHKSGKFSNLVSFFAGRLLIGDYKRPLEKGLVEG